MGKGDLAKVQALVFGARLQWFNLGLQLGVDYDTLAAIRRNFKNETDDCFTEMLSKWLRMTDPPPTYERLIAALEEGVVGYPDIAKKVKEECAKSTCIVQ